jgi:hypothetical protein
MAMTIEALRTLLGRLERELSEARIELVRLEQAESRQDERSRKSQVRQVRGSLKGKLPSSAAYLAEKHAELEREER